MIRTFLIALLLTASCCAQSVAPAPEFEDNFNRDNGWTGADGTYSIPMGEDLTLWLFSDTFFGPIVEGRRDGFEMVNNSLAIQRGEEVEFLQAPTFRPPDKVGWFWMMDATYNGEFEVLLGQFAKDGGGIFGFKQVGTWYARFALDYPRNRAKVLEYKKLPHFRSRKDELVAWGSAIYDDPVWTYIFGTHDVGPVRNYVVARVPRGRMRELGAWRFYDGKGWTKDVWAVKSLFEGASNESSVHRTQDGGFFCVGSRHEPFGSKIVGRYAPSMFGPWSEEMILHTAPEVKDKLFSYNAKAHPELSHSGRLLISYNLNTTDLAQVVNDSDIYRPRFFWWTPPKEGWLPPNAGTSKSQKG